MTKEEGNEIMGGKELHSRDQQDTVVVHRARIKGTQILSTVRILTFASQNTHLEKDNCF
jgi:hypothetical protein